MSKVNQTLLTAIDVGSAKTCALTAEITDTGSPGTSGMVFASRAARVSEIIVDLEKAIASVQKRSNKPKMSQERRLSAR